MDNHRSFGPAVQISFRCSESLSPEGLESIRENRRPQTNATRPDPMPTVLAIQIQKTMIVLMSREDPVVCASSGRRLHTEAACNT